MSDQRQQQRQRGVVSARKWASEHEAGSGRTAFTIPSGVRLMTIQKAGPVRFDIIPFVAGEGNPNAAPGEIHWERTFFVHRNVGPNRETYVCPAKTSRQSCPICEYRSQRFNDPDISEREMKELGELKPKERQLFNVVNRDVEGAGIQLFEYSYFLFGDFLKKKLDNMDPEDDYDLFADPARGYTLKVGVSEKKMDRGSCFEMSDIEFKKRGAYPPEVIDDAVCLDELIRVLPYDQLKRIFNALPGGDDGPGEQAPSTRPATARDRRAPRDEEPEPAPSTRRAPRDEEPEPPPSTRRGRPEAAPEPPPATRRSARREPEPEAAPATRRASRPAPEPEPEPDGGSNEFALDELVIYKGGEYEVKAISPDGGLLTLEDENGERYKGIPAELCRMYGPESEEPEPEPAPAPRRQAAAARASEPAPEPAPSTRRNRPAPREEGDDLPPPRTTRRAR